MAKKRIGILTGGGDVPGLNAVIKTVIYRGSENDIEIIGIRRGWEALTHVNLEDPTSRRRYVIPLNRENTRTIDRSGGTLLHSSRTNPSKMKKLPDHLAGKDFPAALSTKGGTATKTWDVSGQVLKNLSTLGIDHLIAVGGDDTLSYAAKLDTLGVKVIAVPKTMDNDVRNTEYCIGFSTAISRATDAIKRQRTTVGSHERIGIFRVFGRDAGYTALYTAYVTSIRCAIPEYKFNLEKMMDLLVKEKHDNPSNYSLVVLSEGAEWEGYTVQRIRRTRCLRPPQEDERSRVACRRDQAPHRRGDNRVATSPTTSAGATPTSSTSSSRLTFGTMAYDAIMEGKSGLMTAIVDGCYELVPIPDPKLGPRKIDVETMYNTERYRPNYDKSADCRSFCIARRRPGIAGHFPKLARCPSVVQDRELMKRAIRTARTMTIALPTRITDDAAALLGVERSACGRAWRDRLDERGAQRALAIAQRHGLPELLARIVAGRGVEVDEVAAFLEPSVRALMPDPDVLTDMPAAAARLADAVMRTETVAVFGDYDVDGATSAAALARYLRHCGLEPIIHIPDRLFEGYGPNVEAVQALAARGATLLVAVDCGSTSDEPMAEARRCGLDVVVIDHHLANELLPPAVALVNPNRLDDISTLGHLAAVGLVFMTIVALNRMLRRRGFWSAARPEPDLLALLDLVALGTVADVVPLKGLNRAFVAKGLLAMRRRENAGLTALMDVARLNGPPEPWHLGFLLGPRINAGGRIGRATLGVELLLQDDPVECTRLAEELDRLNRERQAIELATLAQADAEAQAALGAEEKAAVIVTAAEGWHPGVVGLVAARLKEKYGRPALAIALEPGGTGTGSGRSIAGVDLGNAVRRALREGLLLKGGGHAMAAGVTVKKEMLGSLRAYLEASWRLPCTRCAATMRCSSMGRSLLRPPPMSSLPRSRARVRSAPAIRSRCLRFLPIRSSMPTRSANRICACGCAPGTGRSSMRWRFARSGKSSALRSHSSAAAPCTRPAPFASTAGTEWSACSCGWSISRRRKLAYPNQ